MEPQRKITYMELFNTINIRQVEQTARLEWERVQRRKRRIEEWLVAAMPFGLVLMFMVFYALSAPHTASLIDKITPGWGALSPVGMELGILIIAALYEVGWRGWLTFGILWLMVAMSVVINVAGGLVSVISLSSADAVSKSEVVQGVVTAAFDIQTATLAQLTAQFTNLPATSQLVLFLVLPIGILIPIMTKFTGEAVIKMALNKLQLKASDIEQQWARECSQVLYQGLYASAVEKGAGAVLASKWAEVAAAQWYKSVSQSHAGESYAPPQSLPIASSQASSRAEMGFVSMVESGGKSTGKLESDLPAEKTPSIPVATPSKLELAKAWLKDNPSDKSLSGRELSAARLPMGVQISHVTWNQAKTEVAKETQ